MKKLSPLVPLAMIAFAFYGKLPESLVAPTKPAEPKVTVPAPSAALQAKVKPIVDWASANAEPAALLKQYYLDWIAVAEVAPSRFGTVKRLSDQHSTALKIFMDAMPPQDAPGAKDAINKAMIAVFGDLPAATVSPAELKEKLNALAWACQS